jgi:hypothetical protein
MSARPKPLTWRQRFGAKRREIDRKLLAEVEAQIAAEERIAAEEANRIARAFGRPT